MKKFGAMIQFVSSFDERGGVFDLLEKFRKFLDDNVSPENFDSQDIKLVYHPLELNAWGDPKR